MSSKKSSPHHRHYENYEDMEKEVRKAKRKNDLIREERKRAREIEENYFRRVRDYGDILEEDLDELD
jgi:hypothetical protein